MSSVIFPPTTLICLPTSYSKMELLFCSEGLLSLSLSVTISQECTIWLTLTWDLCSSVCCSLSLFYKSGVTLMFQVELEPDTSYSAHLHMTFTQLAKDLE